MHLLPAAGRGITRYETMSDCGLMLTQLEQAAPRLVSVIFVCLFADKQHMYLLCLDKIQSKNFLGFMMGYNNSRNERTVRRSFQ